jgi:hypothetical protein
LGHTISTQGVSTKAAKIQAIEQWQTPKNLKDLRGFLGLIEYYRRFIKHYGLISRPLSDLLRKGVPFVWTTVTESALPDFHRPFVLETDVNDEVFGVVLMQNSHLLAYLSKAISAKNQALSTYENECMAIILAIDKWRPYLQHQEFTINTDHKSLLHLTEDRITTKIQQKAVFKLTDLRFKIVYTRYH